MMRNLLLWGAELVRSRALSQEFFYGKSPDALIFMNAGDQTS
jgi:hypothetical protein